MEYNKGFSARYYGTYVDPGTWRDTERFEIISGSVNRTATDLLATASFENHNYPKNTERIIRLHLEMVQNEETERVPLFTGIACSPSDSVNGTIIGNKVDCYSILKYAEDVMLERGWYAPVEVPATELVRQLFENIPAPLILGENAPSLSEAIIAEDGETKLSMAGKILDAVNWRLKVKGDGVIYVLPKSDDPVAVIDPVSYDIIQPEIEISRDWYNCPNVFRAVSGTLTATARDDSPNSYLSTVNRGREIWKEETDCNLSANESVADYALRRLKEEQQINLTAKYDRRFVPDLYPTDVITLNYPSIGLTGDYRIDAQTIEMTHGAKTREEVISL